MDSNAVKYMSIFLLALVILAGVVSTAAAPAKSKLVQRGEYLVKGGVCGDCHTPMKNGPNGPAPDETRMLSGHPESLVMPPAPKLPDGPWLIVGAATMTAWAGPWGVSYGANLSPDPETGLKKRYTEASFIKTLRTGKKPEGEDLLPPMPWELYKVFSDDDIKAIWAYLQSIPAIKNNVKSAVPAKPAAAPAKK
jgi:cytochrome c553